MEYTQVSIAAKEQEQREVLIALLEAEGYEGFEEQEEQLIAFIPTNGYSEEKLSEVLSPMGLSFTTEAIAQQNWNAAWEANFEPVIIEGFCTVRAHFHDINVDTPYEIRITPKMSFGTGHHATTKLMMQQMAGMDFKNKRVLDFGTGTGILAILAELLGAEEILAIDNDEWAYENTLENIGSNSCRKISVRQASLEAAEGSYDTVLANINRHILLQYMADMYGMLNTGGQLLMSGLLVDDKGIIDEAAAAAGFTAADHSEHKGWISLLFLK